MLGMMEAVTTQADKLLEKLANSHSFEVVDSLLYDFYRSNHASFLQARCIIRQYIVLQGRPRRIVI